MAAGFTRITASEGIDVAVGGTGVDVTDTAVSVGGIGVEVNGTSVAVGAESQPETTNPSVNKLTITIQAGTTRHCIFINHSLLKRIEVS
jgi:hypothetical protein